MEKWTNVIQSYVIIRLMRAEERTHHYCKELATMKYLDPHSCLSSHQRCIYHQVEVPIHHRELNENHHHARR